VFRGIIKIDQPNKICYYFGKDQWATIFEQLYEKVTILENNSKERVLN
jgi:hypothetical protein